jgi:predicted RNA binding protein YcfA (HicA-like mRNA interferase family)
MPKKIRELKSMLRRAGFRESPGKGSHLNFWFEGVHGTFITVSGKDGSDARRYLEDETFRVIMIAKNSQRRV